VEADKLGYALAAPSALTENSAQISTDRMMRYELATLIPNACEGLQPHYRRRVG
jgi:hypothetical protein